MRSGEGLWGRGLSAGELNVNQPDYASQVAKANGLQGSIPGHIDPTYQVGITLDDYTMAEFLWLRRSLMGVWAGLQAAVALQAGWIGIQGAPNVLTVIDQLVLVNTTVTAQLVFYGLTTVTPSAGAYFPCPTRDFRSIASQCATTGGVRSSAANTAPGTPHRVLVPATNTVIVPVEYVLAGGGFFSAQCQTLNADFSASIQFRERPLLNSEG